MLRSAGGALAGQAVLHGRLMQVEWAEERRRLARMLVVGVLGGIALIGMLGAVGLLVLTLAWDTPFRIPAVLGLLTACALAVALAWRRLRQLDAHGAQSFVASRAELAADLALLERRP